MQEKRRAFMDVVVQLEPAVMGSLRAVYDSLTKTGTDWRYPSRPAALTDWGGRWHLTDQWCFDWAIERFREWANLPARWDTESGASLLERWNKAGGSIPGGVPSVPEFVASPISWPIAIETESAFRDRAIAQLRDELSAHIEEGRKRARAAGAQPYARKIRDLHIDWLARYQLRGEKLADMFRFNPNQRLKRAAFYNAVRRTAKEIGLTLRPAR